MTKEQRQVRAHEIVIAVLAWLANLPESAIKDEHPLATDVDPITYPTLASELARGLLLTSGEESALHNGLVNGKWDTVGDLVAYLQKTVEGHFVPPGKPAS